MSSIESILDEAKQKVEADLVKARRKVVLVSLFGTIAFAIFFAFWLTGWGVPQYLYWVLVVIAPIILYVVGKRELRESFCQNYYESALESLQNEPQTADDYVFRASTLSRWDYPEAAAEYVRTALEMEPDNLIYLDDMVRILWYDLRNGEDALPYAERLAAIDGNDPAEALCAEIQGTLALEQQYPASAV
ncbi:hypothetical protein FACS1894170_01430 [Planctomycetales bacterium]|nr:hypothetical protein FACS1894170_01430 [Planctomycetales bacterium]